MPSFKPKSNKKIRICKKYTTTLDGKHKEFMNQFMNDEYDNIPDLKKEYNILKNKLESEYTKLSIEQIMDIKDRLLEINKTIKELKTKKNDYFLNNSKFIFEYFENKKNISNNDTKNTSSKCQLVDQFFKIKNENLNINENVNKNIVNKYLCNIDESFLDINAFVRPVDICQYCFKGELIPLDDEGVLICNICSVNVPYLIENEKPSYKEPPKEVCFYAYKKINHFKEILAQYQGKETTQIPIEVIELIKQQIKKERIDL